MKQLPLNTIIQGDAREVLKTFPDESVHCVITSPPYWGLRDYGTEPLIWGGKEDCKHLWGDSLAGAKGKPQTGLSAAKEREDGRKRNAQNTATENGTLYTAYESGQFCQLCGAWRGNLGLEPTPELYVEHIVEISREIKRVLRKDGTFWLNMGDSYASSWSCSRKNIIGQGACSDRANRLSDNLKEKDLCGMPWRVAFALQADGWWLRSDIIWSKPNPMPESVRDRPTRSHEYVFLLTKSSRYFYDAEAIKEPNSGNAHAKGNGVNPKALKAPSGWDTTEERGHNKIIGRYPRSKQNPSFSGTINKLVAKKNRRSVWTIATQPYLEAHFATFPEKLVKPMILAGTSEKGACAKCGTPWERIVEKESYITRPTTGRDTQKQKQKPEYSAGLARTGGHVAVDSRTIGWKPTCECSLPLAHFAGVKPCVVLDPFVGSGTVALVAEKLNRNVIGIDLKQEYVEMSKERVRKFNEQARLL